MALGGVATMYTENEGHLGARATEYAQDKMEQLLALAHGHGKQHRRVPAAGTGGTGLAVGGN
jgi:hypothetical protein